MQHTNEWIDEPNGVGDVPYLEEAHTVSEYPVIVTLENHCTRKKRDDMAKIIQEELGKKLYIPPSSRTEVWPSPASLKGRVIIRDKLKHKQDGKLKKGLEAEASSVTPGVLKSAAEAEETAGTDLLIPDDEDEDDGRAHGPFTRVFAQLKV